MSSISLTPPMRPIVETGIFSVSVVIWPAGKVRLLAASTPVTCAMETPLSVSFSGSRVMRICCSSPPVMSTLPTPSMPSRAGSISALVIASAFVSPSADVAAMDAMITGDELMFSAVTCGDTAAGSPALCRFCSMAARISLTSDPNENCAMTRDSEFADVDWMPFRFGTPEMARSTGLVTCVATSAAPAPGSEEMTVMTGKSMLGSSSCLRLPQATIPEMNSAPARRSVTLRLLTANWERRLMRDPFALLRRGGGTRVWTWRRVGQQPWPGRRGRLSPSPGPGHRGARAARASGGR